HRWVDDTAVGLTPAIFCVLFLSFESFGLLCFVLSELSSRSASGSNLGFFILHLSIIQVHLHCAPECLPRKCATEMFGIGTQYCVEVIVDNLLKFGRQEFHTKTSPCFVFSRRCNEGRVDRSNSQRHDPKWLNLQRCFE